MSELTTATLGRTTEREALLTAADLAGLLLPDVLTWRVCRDRDGVVTVDGQLCNDSPADLADWMDMLDGSRIETRDVPGIPFGTLSVVGMHGGAVVRIWTAITRPVPDPDPDAAYKADIEADLVGGAA
jgi:hypothetical protein